MSEASLAKSLIGFQKECPSLDFDKSVSTKKYNFKYVSLGHMIAMTKPILAKYGLAVVQCPTVSQNDGTIRVTSTLLSDSGESLQYVSEMQIPVNMRDGEALPASPQDVGSAISYARRYAYAAILGLVADEDNDGLPIDVMYQDTAEDKTWLKMSAEKLGITNIETVKKIHQKMLDAKATKEEANIKKFID